MIGVAAVVVLIVALGALVGRFTALTHLRAAVLVAVVPAVVTVLITGEFLPDAGAVIGMLLVALLAAAVLASAGTAIGRARRLYLERIA